MNITARQDPKKSLHEHIAHVITVEGIKQSFALDLDFSAILDRSSQHPVRGLDFLLIASTVYAIDKIVPRASAPDLWKRTLDVTMPLHEPAPWGIAVKTLSEALSYLTGDEWSLEFVQAEAHFAQRRRNRRKRPIGYPQSPVVSLLSGGLDSFIGALDLLMEHKEGRILFVSHYDGHVSGPASDQDNLRMFLDRTFLGRISHLQVRTGVRVLEESIDDEDGDAKQQEKPKKYKFETSFRSRSLVFLGLAGYAASKVGGDIPILIPENGPIALNLPLNPSRRGACSTRTVHPQFISTLQAALGKAGINNPIRNPYEFKTKGEMISECKAEELLKAAYAMSNSCGKAGRKTHWQNRKARACGACIPCLLRRASLYAKGWDTEVFGNEVLSRNPEEYPDFHALLGLIRRNPSVHEIAKSLLANGRLPIIRLTDYASVVRRMLDEVVAWLGTKGSAKARKLAGVKRTAV
jgi:7-cyano-7-deazaguanine synthase in queuosine biosynthesis